MHFSMPSFVRNRRPRAALSAIICLSLTASPFVGSFAEEAVAVASGERAVSQEVEEDSSDYAQPVINGVNETNDTSSIAAVEPDGDTEMSDQVDDQDVNVKGEGGVDEGSFDNAALIESNDVVQAGFAGNSWRYSDGLPVDKHSEEGVSLFSIDGRVQDNGTSWTRQSDGTYVSSKGVTVKGADCIGIDVSEHQGSIDWEKVRGAGIDFAMLRAGWGYSTSGESGIDKAFLNNVRGCIDNDIPFGVYLYSYAWDTDSASDEATNLLRILERAALKPSDIALGIFYDMENEGVSWGKYPGIPCGINERNQEVPIKGEAAFASIAKTFCDRVSAEGYSAGVYANLNWFNNYLTDDCFDGWMRWVAQYSGDGNCDYAGDYLYWQCMSTGKVDGIYGNVDINFSYVSAAGNWVAPKLKSANTSSGGTKISWSSVPNSAGYAVYRRTADGGWAMFATTTSTSYIDTTQLSSGKTYYYTVRAYWGNEVAAKSNKYEKRYWTGFDSKGLEATFLATPSLDGVSASSGGRKVSWGVVPGASGYAVYRKPVGGSWKMIDTTTSTSFTDKAPLSSGATYHYTVRAYRGSESVAKANKYSARYWGYFDTVGKSIRVR